jgi:hypothetical protein
MHKLSKKLVGVRSDRFHAALFWMSLEDNREPRLASEKGRYFYTIFTRFSISLSAWVVLESDRILQWDPIEFD